MIIEYTDSFSGEKKQITDRQIILFHISKAVSDWLRDNGDKAPKHCTRLDLDCEITGVIRDAWSKADKAIEEPLKSGQTTICEPEEAHQD